MNYVFINLKVCLLQATVGSVSHDNIYTTGCALPEVGVHNYEFKIKME